MGQTEMAPHSTAHLNLGRVLIGQWPSDPDRERRTRLRHHNRDRQKTPSGAF